MAITTLGAITPSKTYILSSPPAACIYLPSFSSPTFLIGTYTLDRLTQTRTGSLILYSLNSAADNSRHLETLDLEPRLGSILDIKGIYVATSTGYVLEYRTSPAMAITVEHRIADEKTLVLSLALHPMDSTIIAATLSNSKILLLSTTDFEVLATIEDAHTGLEVWTSCFSPKGDRLYTGGDDSCFVTYLMNLDAKNLDERLTQIKQDRKTHTAGVTSILPLGKLTLTGSYDDYLRVYSPSTQKFVGEGMDIDGGVWRMEVLDEEAGVVLVSAMHAGARVVRVSIVDGNEEVVIEILAKMEEHDSMNYASAAVKVGGKEEDKRSWRVLSTSFYDRKVCEWGFFFDKDTPS